MGKIMRAVEMGRCIGCYSCMLACARQVHGSLSLGRSGIQVRTRGGLTAGFEAIYCLACREAPCVESCPTGAFQQREGGGVRFHRDSCIGCGNCQGACPVDAVIMDRERGTPVVCYHCGYCISYCPQDCLAMEKIGDKENKEGGRG